MRPGCVSATPGFYAGIAKLGSVDVRALQKHKPSATWGEITDVDGQPTWVIPKTRMKGRKMHRVPLTPQAVALLGERRADNVPLFKVSSANAMLYTLKANGGNGFTVHGFRTSFQEYVAAETNFPDDLADRCIAHERRSKVRKAYQREPKRREIMVAWSDFATSLTGI
jgi:integrase